MFIGFGGIAVKKKVLNKAQSSFISAFNTQTLMRYYHISPPDDEMLSLVHFEDLSSCFPSHLSDDCEFHSCESESNSDTGLKFGFSSYCILISFYFLQVS